MSKKLSPFAFIITLVLLVTSILPSQASANGNLSLLWEKEFNGHFFNETAATSKNETLISMYEISEDSNYNRVYTYDFMKLDATGSLVESKKLTNGQTKIFEYDGQAYVAFMNNATQTLELFDENFELVNSKPVRLEGNASITIKDNIIALTTGGLEYRDGIQGVFYSLITLEEINPSQLPIERYVGLSKYDPTGADNYYIVGLTFADTVVKEIPLNLSQFKSGQPIRYNDSVVEMNGYFYAALDVREEKEYYVDSIELFKIDLKGNIVDSLKVLEADFYSADDSIILNDKIIFALDQYYEYDLTNFGLTKSYTTGSNYPEIGKLTSDMYYYQIGNDMIFADFNGNEKYRIPGLDYAKASPNQYFIGTVNWNDHVYSVATGEKILEDTGFNFGVHYDQVVAYKGAYTSSNYEDYKSVVKLYGEKSDKPVGETFLPNKKWTITFNSDVNEESVSDASIYVLDETGNKVDGLSFTTIGDTVEVYAPATGYDTGKTYTLYVTKAVQSTKEISLKEERTKVFTIK